MNKIIKLLCILLLSVIVNSSLNYVDNRLWLKAYDKCRIEIGNLKDSYEFEDVITCTNNQLSVKILGTLLFTDGSILINKETRVE